MTEDQIKHMVDRFLSWRLPENFSPDCGIRFDAEAAMKLNPRNARYEPSGTNLLDATQATAMVRHMLESLPVAEKPEPNPEWEADYDAFHAATRAEVGIEPEMTLTMLKTWKAHAEPVNELGQASFSRAMLDSAADALQVALDRLASLPSPPPQGEGS